MTRSQATAVLLIGFALIAIAVLGARQAGERWQASQAEIATHYATGSIPSATVDRRRN